MTEPEDELVAWLYEIGGRRGSDSARMERPVYASELLDPIEGAPVPDAAARAAYRARVAARASRRRGGS